MNKPVIIRKYGVAQTHTHPDANRTPSPPHKRKKAVSTAKSKLSKPQPHFSIVVAGMHGDSTGYNKPGSERK